MKRLTRMITLLILVFTLCSCKNNKSSKEYYQGTDLEQLETFTNVTGIELNTEKDAPESNSKLYNYLADNNANGLGAILKYEAYLEEYGFKKVEDSSDEEIAIYLMDGYIIVTGKFSPQPNVIQYGITIPNTKNAEIEEAGSAAEEPEDNKAPEMKPPKDEHTLYSEFCTLVDDGNYAEALDYFIRESLSLNYSDTKDYYNYATAMNLYLDTEFLTYPQLLDVVQILTDQLPNGFKDSSEISERIEHDLEKLIGTHVHQRDSKYMYDLYYLIISEDGKVTLDMCMSEDGIPAASPNMQLAYVNLEKGSYYMLCPNYLLDIDHCEYSLTIQEDSLALSKAWGNIDKGLFSANYTKSS